MTIAFQDCQCVVNPGHFHIDNVDLNCPATWKLISVGSTLGVFQLEKKLGQDWAKRVKPNTIDDLAALISMMRPGALESGASENYVGVKFGAKKAEYIHHALKPILEPTYASMLYQEQVLRIANDLAGFSLEESDTLRKSLGKKDVKLMASLKSKFALGCQKKGIEPAIAEEIFGWIEKCQRYLFNKCVSGDTILKRSAGQRCQKTVSHLYHIRNNLEYAKKYGHESLRKKWNGLGHYGHGLSLCSDGRLRPNIIRDIQLAGTQQLYKVTLENGSSIRITLQHKFPTPNGEKTLEQLRIGDSLYLCGEYEQSDFVKISKFSDKTKEHKHRKYESPQEGFHCGISNPAYTNGSYTKFKQYKDTTPDICQQCGKTNCRIEVAHLNGDRTNSYPANLRKLCASCHKKHDYGLGRVKRGEKGYPHQLSKIRSIELDKIEETFDVTMDGPNHNFVTGSNIVTCNSHAVAYAVLAYKTAWLKCHFPLEFFASYLTYSNYKMDPKEEVYRLVQDARLFDINILPPDIRQKNVQFEIVPDSNTIRFGLGSIRGVGETAIQKIISENSLNSWPEFLAAVPDLHRNVGVALIKAGACDRYGLERNRMVQELEAVLGTSDAIDENGDKKPVKGLTEKEKVYFFAAMTQNRQATVAEILSQMALPVQKTKSLSAMKIADVRVVAEKFLRQMIVDQKSIVDIDASLFVHTTETEIDGWIMDALKRPKTDIIQLLKHNGYVDDIAKSPCANDARRNIIAEKVQQLATTTKDTKTGIAAAEKHFLGISLTASAVDDIDTSDATHNCIDVAKELNGPSIIVCAIIDEVKLTKTKRGKTPGQSMCFLTISDSSYSIDHAVVFPDNFDRLKGLCKVGHICLFYGSKKNGSFLIDDMTKLI